jgi:hypothetical protein
MIGVITSWDILAHPISTIRCFGWQVFFRAVIPWQDTSFRSLVGVLKSPVSNMPTILERCIDLELQAKRIYRTLGRALSNQELVTPFLAGLAEQEQYHADLLAVCRAAVIRCGWSVGVFSPWLAYLPRLEQQMDAVEAAVQDVDSVDAALRLVIQIESSEINNVFSAALAATDAAFVKRLKPFRKAMEAHMSYLVERIPELSPRLIVNVREFRARFPNVRN